MYTYMHITLYIIFEKIYLLEVGFLVCVIKLQGHFKKSLKVKSKEAYSGAKTLKSICTRGFHKAHRNMYYE